MATVSTAFSSMKPLPMVSSAPWSTSSCEVGLVVLLRLALQHQRLHRQRLMRLRRREVRGMDCLHLVGAWPAA